MMEMDLPIKRLRRSMSQITQGPVRVEYLYDMDGMWRMKMMEEEWKLRLMPGVSEWLRGGSKGEKWAKGKCQMSNVKEEATTGFYNNGSIMQQTD